MRNLPATALLLSSIMCITSRAAVLPSQQQQLVDTLHQVVSAATKETGLRLKRSTSEEWDKELDLTAIGVLFRVKLNNTQMPQHGGKAHIKFPGSRFIRNAPFDDVDLQVEFDGSQLHKGLVDLKIDYKFVQKFKHKADLPRQGSISLTSLENGMKIGKLLKLVMKRASNEQPLEHLLDLSFKWDNDPSHLEFSSIVDYKVGNYFDLKGKIDKINLSRLVKKANIDLTVNGFVYSAKAELDLAQKKLSLVAAWESRSFFIDVEVNPGEKLGVAVKGNLGAPLEAEMVMQRDLSLGQFKISFDGQNLAFAQLKGEADPQSGIPKKFNYVLKYNVGSEAGKAKIEFDRSSLQFTLVPTAEKSIEHVLKMSLEGPYDTTFKYQWDIQLEGTNVLKTAGILYVNDNSTEFHLTTEDTLEQTKENPFFETFNKLYGMEVTTAKETGQIYISKDRMDEILNNQIFKMGVNKVLFEEESLVNGQLQFHVKYDNRAPKTKYLLRYAPQDHPEAEWKYEGGREVGSNSFKVDHKISHGETVVQEGMISFQSGSNLPMVSERYLQTLTTCPESPVYPLIQAMVGRHVSKIVHQGSLDLQLRFSAGLQLNLNNFKLATSMTVDEQKISEVLIDNHNSGMRKATLRHIWSPDTFGNNHEVTVDWKPNTSVSSPKTGLDFAMAYKRANQSILSYTNKASWETSDSDEDFMALGLWEEFIQTEESPLYSWGPTLQGKYWRDAKRTLKLETKPKLIISEETFLDEELYRKVDIVINEDRSGRFSWEQPGSGELFPSTRDVFNQDKVEFTMAHHSQTDDTDDPVFFELTSNIPNVRSLNATYQTIQVPAGIDNLAKLTHNGEDLVTFKTDSTDNSVKLTVFPGRESETMASLAVPSMPYPAWPSSLVGSDVFPEIESSTARNLVFNMTKGQNRVDVVMSGLDNFIYGHSMFEPQSIGLDVGGNLPSLGEFKISREAQFQVFGEPERISTYKIQWSGHDEISEGGLAAFSPMDTMVVVDINDTDGDSTIESFLKSSSIQAYKSFGGKRWGVNLSKDNIRIITGIDCKDPISC